MKKYLLLVAALFMMGANSFAQLKVGYVDSQVILQQLPEAVKAQGDLDAMVKGWNAKIDSMAQRLQADYADYKKQEATMTPDKQKEAQQALIAKEQEINIFKQSKFAQGGEIYKKQEELLAPVKEKIMKGIAQIAKEEKMQFIFDKSGEIVLLYADAAYDMTYKVLDKLKRGK